MLRVSIYTQTNRSNNFLKFRLRDGDRQLYYQTGIITTPDELATLNQDGTIKPRFKNANRELSTTIQTEMSICREVYMEQVNNGHEMNTTTFADAMDRRLHPAKYEVNAEKPVTLLGRFQLYIDTAYKYGVIQERRRAAYRVLHGQLTDYLRSIRNTSMKVTEFTPAILADFRDFLCEEKKGSQNTISTKMKELHAFFAELEDTDEVVKSPFRGVGKNVRRAMMKQTCDEPIYLTCEELQTIAKTDVPKSLKECKETFLLHCQLGARVEDFHRLSLDNLYVSEEGIPYLRYIPSKTEKEGQVVETPLTRAALETILRTGFQFTILNYVSGKSGYNKKIGQLLQHCGIERKVTVTENCKKVQRPIFDNVSSKTARKTYVSAMARVQINIYASGLHKVGSTAVNHYFSETLRDRFVLTCAAFGETIFAVDKQFNIIPA